MVSSSHIDQHLETREAILEAAAALFAELGYQHMTIDEVAKRASVGKGTVYLYFESKQELALSIIDRINDRLRDRLRVIAKSRGSVPDRVGRMLMERIMYKFEAVSHYRECVDQMLGCLRPLLLERRSTYLDLEAAIFMEVLVEGRVRGEIVCDEPLETSRILLTATASLLPYSLSPRELGSKRNLQLRAESLVRFLVEGLSKSTCDHGEKTVRGNR